MRLTFRTAFLFAVAALSMGAAQAIDKSTPLLLMDDGFGSSSSYGFMDYTDDACMILGQKNDMLGRSIPMMWQVEDGVTTATPLPLPTGFSGVAMGWAKFPNHETIITGNVTDNNGNAHAVVWRSVSYGPWQMPVRLSPLTALDICGHEMQHGVQADVAGSVFQNGAWRPVVFTIKQNLDISHTLLPAPPGGGGCTGIDGNNGPGSRTSATGFIRGADGRMRPALWINDGAGWEAMPIQIPANTSGRAYRSNPRDDGVVNLVGDLSRNGRTMGFYTDNLGNNLVGLRPLPGFQNSTAYNLGDTGTHEVGHWIWGDSSTEGVDDQATMWLPLALDDYGPFPVQSFLSDPNSVARVTSYRPGQGCVVGSAIPGGSVLSQACVFLPSGDHAADNVEVPVGRVMGGDVGSLVHNDGEMYGVRTGKVNNQRMACVDMQFNPLSFSAGQDARMDALIMVPNQVTGATINVYFFNYATNQFQPFYTNSPGGGLLGISAALPSSNEWQDPQTGQIILRFEFKHSGNAPRTIGIETIEIAHEG